MMGARLTETAAEPRLYFRKYESECFCPLCGVWFVRGALLGAISKLTVSSVAHCWCLDEAERKD